MVINNPKTWARQNKRKFANRLITESRARAGDEPAAFFMAMAQRFFLLHERHARTRPETQRFPEYLAYPSP